ncbi:MAG: Thiosulfate sulfurtransferase GlpE [Candidatus Accumulibacter regalis]|jgi:rhodanese-related sulfurtransferase|uniref:Thiosulfate sulfurtransferase GlpE n=1 Tax=Accumulibacter regalis TaxID=522306 RepID=A0A011P1J2_ACCRE|nr:rhodanese-like domain-containing protein [Accumulibacter sp.]EXI88858.1 MAG: Thiosulfate sulfurtransferase GlpE [Candidatus Accumulibacter regalis]HRE69736.1 rhodanese-like domain-containing protein [Accumulibacter sp.]HRE85072.1 rhodanese-like domain-containing protein [Accumulibacter sp.]
MQQLSATQLKEWLTASTPAGGSGGSPARRPPLLLDVREPWEFELCHLADSLLLPMQSVPARIDELERDADIVVICHHGVRSRQVGGFLERQGFTSIYNLSGGVDAWANDVDPAMHKY